MLLRAIADVQEGRDPPHVIRRPEDNHFEGMGVKEEQVPSATTWKMYREHAEGALVAPGVS